MKIIGISAPSMSSGTRAMFNALGDALGLAFETRTFGDDKNVDAWVVLASSRASVPDIRRSTRPCYVVLDDAELSPCGASAKVTFANHPGVAEALRGRDVTADDAVGLKALPPWLSAVSAVAFKDGSAVWAIEGRDDARHHYVAMSPPELKDGEALFTHLSGQRIVCLLPLVLFSLSVTEEACWQPPPLQAAFMFDDPNLHWTSYGFVDYGEMVRHAVAGNYHVSMATIPLDGWFVYPPACAIFRENTQRVSLLYHGNDHESKELARNRSAEAVRCMLRQAMARIAGMEARSGLEVARVMAPPHGACSETTLAEMAGVGFEALCVSRGSLRHYNPDAAWSRTIGMKPCDIVAGLPVIPRFGLSSDCRNDILIAALLRQPIVPMTHHQALADGYALLDDTAAIVNSLGEVAWRDMKTISRSLYSTMQDRGTLRVRMLSKRVSVSVPPGTTRIQVEGTESSESAEQGFLWRAMSGEVGWKAAARSELIPVQAGATIEVASGPARAARAEMNDAGGARLAPVARRVLTEARDRALPSIRLIARTARLSGLA